jgi:hypothetical protein
MIVMMMARTPSLKVSNRLLLIADSRRYPSDIMKDTDKTSGGQHRFKQDGK